MRHARSDYNRIQDPEERIPENEPVFLLRAQDILSTKVVLYWTKLLIKKSRKAVIKGKITNEKHRENLRIVKKVEDWAVEMRDYRKTHRVGKLPDVPQDALI